MKRLRIGRRRQQVTESSPLELARAPALVDGKWKIPDRYNFTRDVVEVLAEAPSRQALTFVGPDSVIEPRTFRELAEGSNKWAFILRDRGVQPGDRVLILSDATVDWMEAMLGCIKAGVVAVPCSPLLPAAALEARVSMSGASLVLASDPAKGEIAQMSFTPEVHHIYEGRRRRATDVVEEQPTTDTSARDVAVLAWTSGTTGTPKPVALTHGWTFAVRSQVGEWLDAGPRDIVWCTAPPGSTQALVGTLFGPWAQGAQVVLHGDFEPMERLELIHRFQTTILLQSAAEYKALAERPELPRFRSAGLRRLVSTGDSLDPAVIATFEEAWGLTIHDGYGQAETGIVIGNGEVPPPPGEEVDEEAEEQARESVPTGSLGLALPGHHVAVVDEQGNELPHGVEGLLAIRGRPPTLFAGYWDMPAETRQAFRGDWYLTGDVAMADEDGRFWFVGRSEDVITSRGRTFGPHTVEQALRRHPAVSDTAVVGIPDLQRGGHFVRAYVVLLGGLEESEQLEAEVREFVADSVLEQQVPREIVFVEELPRGMYGAVRRGELRDRPVAARPLWEKAAAPEPEPTAEAPAEPTAEVAPEAAPILEAPPVPPAGTIPEVSRETGSPPIGSHAAENVAVPEKSEPTDPVGLAPVQEQGPTFVGLPDPAETVEPAMLSPVEEQAPTFLVEPDPIVTHVEPESVPPPPSDLVAEASPTPEPVFDANPPAEPGPQPEVTQVAEAVPPEQIPQPPDSSPASRETAHEVQPEPTAEAITVEPSDELRESKLEAVSGDATSPPVERPPHEPLPDYVVDPGSRLEPAGPPPPPAPEPEEEDLGPLPDYVVDPSRRLEALPDPDPAPGSSPAPDPGPSPATPAPPEVEGDPSRPSFPPTPALDLDSVVSGDRATEDEPERARRSRPRPRPQTVEGGTSKRGGPTAEPGDETGETSWMRGLSSRLSAYSLGSEERPSRASDPENEDGPEDADQH